MLAAIRSTAYGPLDDRLSDWRGEGTERFARLRSAAATQYDETRNARELLPTFATTGIDG
jgi:hypothetical protein